MTIREIGDALRKREFSCVELIRQTFAAIRERDKYNSFITLTEEAALDHAAVCDAEFGGGVDRGPLHGVPVAVKDLFYTRGVRTTGGSLVYADFVPDFDATIVSKLQQARAVSVGKTNLHELAYGVTSNNPHYGPVLNPRDPTRIPGGSSGGSASLVAAGLLPMCLGTDTGGSIRIPASYCGIVGLKPTYGRVSRHGVLPLAFSLDHVGPLGSCVEDCALTMNVIADGSDEFNLDSLPDLRGVRVGVPTDSFFDRVTEEVAAAVRKTVEEMGRNGASIVEVDVPKLADVNVAALVVQLAEASALYANYVDSSLFSEGAWELLQRGRLIAGHEYVNAQRLRTVYQREFEALWHKIDLIAAPTTPITAPLLSEVSVEINGEDEEVRMASTRLVRAMNFLGLPALSMPCGYDSKGLPVGLQLISRADSEPRLLQISKAVERLIERPGGTAE